MYLVYVYLLMRIVFVRLVSYMINMSSTYLVLKVFFCVKKLLYMRVFQML